MKLLQSQTVEIPVLIIEDYSDRVTVIDSAFQHFILLYAPPPPHTHTNPLYLYISSLLPPSPPSL